MEQHYHQQNQLRQLKQQQLKELLQQQSKDKEEDEQKHDDYRSPTKTTTTTATSTSAATIQSPIKSNEEDDEIDNSQHNNDTLQISEPEGESEIEEIWEHAFDPLPTSVSKNSAENVTNLGGINARVFSLSKPIYHDPNKLDLLLI
ncbi:hypothetical protein DDB_G0280675 [Dictyostelium discoideum AX4]|uniref:Putative uncharacterized protein DDB_G0280675 n=1 Tax=Dictyostelium discoideum TaxID=44689 RepID=Y6116_DICDI|nr:hypothetical protein DDB_G0280675 [Dictyostelium discoideum AX4]Q54V15.1 RecName: Full=Putative uncharacterized protein DDB_G0280675 [Dictyostelium discoideum]EAL67139.1 hypothetical protein DDB_G0280675 [Dictyostelium discoideum AX4]|eukprot:XP_641116.1 hypothetical protein DDB_G0280675 [Dictyostelium discoideum AX4]